MNRTLLIALIILMGLQFSCKPKATERSAGNQPKKVSDKGVNIIATQVRAILLCFLFMAGPLTGHYPMNEKPDDFNKALEGIIADLRK